VSPAYDWRSLAATVHRPTDPALIASEIRRLHGTGLTARDVSVALRLDLGVVLEALHAGSQP
jgi:hypothetical protein